MIFLSWPSQSVSQSVAVECSKPFSSVLPDITVMKEVPGTGKHSRTHRDSWQ